MSNTPLPPIVERADEHYHGEGLADAVHAHAAAVSAADNASLRESLDDAESLCVAKQSEIDALRKLRHEQVERIKMLEDVLRIIVNEQDARQGYASVETYDAARAALGDKNG